MQNILFKKGLVVGSIVMFDYIIIIKNFFGGGKN